MSSLRLDGIYTDKMVIPANKNFHISGHATPKSEVCVKILNHTYRAVADDIGTWKVRIVLEDKITCDIKITNLAETITLHDVKSGKVILLTGQSNIEFKFRDDSEYQSQIDDLNLNNTYFYNVPQVEYQSDRLTLPKDLKTSTWQIANKETLWEMSDIGYWIAKKMHELNPKETIGIIDCYKGGTSISSWVPESVLTSSQELINRFIKPFEKATTNKTQEDYDQEFAEYNALVEKHNVDLAKFQKENPDVSLSDAKDKVGHTPWPPPMTPTSYLRPSGLFHTMIEQVKNYSFNKVVWYQGENDADNPEVYGIMLRGLILSWRGLFQDFSVPFLVVQLPGYFDEPESAWPKIRQHQLETSQRINDVHLVSIADTGEKHNIHPTHKRITGTRIGEILSDQGYSSTPSVYHQQILNDKLVLSVSSVSTLVQKGDAYFLVKQNNQWKKREIRTVGKVIVLDNCQGIEKIRYAYDNYPTCTLFNELGAPVAPFEMEIEKNE
ncbi:sialate O-acetylesterase [Companilactobacillus farciminis]|uniref:sialate O-acetylesterase n=1 Tax=Companilactobacillus farciminis TaxID=1612 RepID=UPI0034D5624C